jgi:hypothetical protein
MNKYFFIVFIFFVFFISCSDNIKQKELELKEKQLLIKERQLYIDSLRNTRIKQHKILKANSENKIERIQKLKFPSGYFKYKNEIYDYYFSCTDEIWGSCELKIISRTNKKNSITKFSNSNAIVNDIQLIDNYLYFYSEEAGGSAGNLTYIHFLIDLDNNSKYFLRKDCHVYDYSGCKLKNKTSFAKGKFKYIESEEINFLDDLENIDANN